MWWEKKTATIWLDSFHDSLYLSLWWLILSFSAYTFRNRISLCFSVFIFEFVFPLLVSYSTRSTCEEMWWFLHWSVFLNYRDRQILPISDLHSCIIYFNCNRFFIFTHVYFFCLFWLNDILLYMQYTLFRLITWADF